MDISVVMAVHNAGPHLRAAVESVLAQTRPDFELLVIDDGSTDDTAGQLAQFHDSRLRVLTQSNQGLVASLNRGITEARGKYIARMDGDDRCRPDRLAIQSDYLDKHPDIALLGGAVATMDTDGNPLAPCVRFPATHEQIWAEVGRRPWVFCHPAVMYRRAAAIDVGMYRQSFAHAEDAEFFARLMTKYRAVNQPEVVLDYRLGRGAISMTKKDHGRVNAALVATIIDRWKRGEPFEPTAAERAAADAEIERSSQSVSAGQSESAYQCRLGRELLRGRAWRRAVRHYGLAIKNDWTNRSAYVGLAAGLLRSGGGPIE